MKTLHFSIALKKLAFAVLMTVIASCYSGSDSKQVAKTDSSESSNISSVTESIPDSIVQFLITSAAHDFHSHQPPTPVDFRNVKAGYTLSSSNEKIFTLCGEFLSKEKKEEWITFATVKTSGYEQYLGDGALPFCQKATMVLSNEALSEDLKRELAASRKEK